MDAERPNRLRMDDAVVRGGMILWPPLWRCQRDAGIIYPKYTLWGASDLRKKWLYGS